MNNFLFVYEETIINKLHLRSILIIAHILIISKVRLHKYFTMRQVSFSLPPCLSSSMRTHVLRAQTVRTHIRMKAMQPAVLTTTVFIRRHQYVCHRSHHVCIRWLCVRVFSMLPLSLLLQCTNAGAGGVSGADRKSLNSNPSLYGDKQSSLLAITPLSSPVLGSLYGYFCYMYIQIRRNFRFISLNIIKRNFGKIY